MADTFYARLTGQETAAGAAEIELVMSDRTLVRSDHQPVHVPGYGSIRAFLARRIVHEGTTRPAGLRGAMPPSPTSTTCAQGRSHRHNPATHR